MPGPLDFCIRVKIPIERNGQQGTFPSLRSHFFAFLGLLALFTIFMAPLRALATPGNWGDAYRNFAELSAHQREGVDYQIQLVNRHSPITVLAIHGGGIEVGTTELAERIAGSEWSYYSFLGIKSERPNDLGLRPRRNGVLHLTSHHFDEPQALDLVQSPGQSDYCLSIHGFFEDAGRSIACVGGGNSELRDNVAQEIRSEFSSGAFRVAVEVPCRRFGGTDPNNIANRCHQRGMQLELSHSLRRQTLENPEIAERLAGAIRRAAQRLLRE